MQTTGKKVKVVGTQQYINAQTGTLETMQVTSIEDRDFNFHKIWMRNFIATIDLVGNQKTKVAFWIIDNLNRDNQLLYTYRQIAEKTKVSLDTVRLTMGILLDSDFLRKATNGCYIVNPEIVFKGQRGSRINVLNQFSNAEHVEMSDVQKLASVMESIKTMQTTMDKLMKQANELQKKIADEAAKHDSEEIKSA